MLKEALKKGDSKDLLPIAYAIHQLTNYVPVAMRSKEKPGVRIEKNKVLDYNYDGPVLNMAIQLGQKLKVSVIDGPYKGCPVIVVPIKDGEEVLGAVGVVDITGGLLEDLLVMSRRPELAKYLPDEAFLH